MSLWSIFRVVFGKEMRELLRDRKALFWLLAPPIILPAIALIAVAFIGTQTAHYITQGFPIAVVNGKVAPALVQSLKRSGILIVNEVADGATDPDALIILTVPDDFQRHLDAGDTAHLVL